MSQGFGVPGLQPDLERKMAPKIGAIRRKQRFRRGAETKRAISPTLDLQGSEPGIGQVAVAYRDAGAGHQQAVEDGHESANEAGGRNDVDGSDFGHLVPFFKGSRRLRRDLGLT